MFQNVDQISDRQGKPVVGLGQTKNVKSMPADETKTKIPGQQSDSMLVKDLDAHLL